MWHHEGIREGTLCPFNFHMIHGNFLLLIFKQAFQSLEVRARE